MDETNHHVTDIRYTALTLALRLAEITPEVADPERVVEIARVFEAYLTPPKPEPSPKRKKVRKARVKPDQPVLSWSPPSFVLVSRGRVIRMTPESEQPDVERAINWAADLLDVAPGRIRFAGPEPGP